jgi:hypothetical protein
MTVCHLAAAFLLQREKVQKWEAAAVFFTWAAPES